jgi:DhnA family fructose-bisphosphate aldolase class Ia
MTEDLLSRLLELRVRSPERIAEAAAARTRPTDLVGQTGRLLLVAADHPARGAMRAGDRPMAMADRMDMLRRLVTALERPGVDGVLGTADVLEDLLLLGALDGKVVVGSMNRGGLAGTSFEIDDRFTGYRAEAVRRMGWQGGKMLVRIDPEDTASVATLEACANVIDELADRRLMAMVEPFLAHRVDGRVRNVLTPEAVIRSSAVASGLGSTSAYTWLKLPVVEDMEAVLAATTLPVLLLGGEVAADQEQQLAQWRKALSSPSVRGMVAGRTLLYPPGDDVAAAVDATVGLM